MWKVMIVGWKMLPRRHKRTVIVAAGTTARRHGPTVVRAAARAYRAARTPPGA